MRLGAWSLLAAIACLWTARPASAAENAGEQVSHFFGSLSYTVPIEVPSFHGIEPRLALTYTSEGRNGQLGVGWTLSGISTIEWRTYPWLDGQQLIPCSAISPPLGPSCTTGGTHATKDESYLRIQLVGSNFHVYGKDGTKTTLSPILPTTPASRWGPTSVVDTRANSVSYAWNCTGGDCYPGTISYNGYSVSFYLEPRPDPLSFGAVDRVGTTTSRVRSIVVRLGATLIRAYSLGYTTSAATGRSLLTSVQQHGKDAVVDASGAITGGTALPAQTFDYQDDAIAKSFVPTTSGAGTAWCEGPPGFLRTGDFNGDGRIDLLCATYSNVRVALGTATGFAPPMLWSSDWFGVTALGDFNGDGKTDIAYWTGHYFEGGAALLVALSTGSSFGPMTIWTRTLFCDGDVQFATGDSDADGRTDIFCHVSNHPTPSWSYAGYSTGSSFSWVYMGDMGCGYAPRSSYIDVNGDGRDDWICEDDSWASFIALNLGSTWSGPTWLQFGCPVSDRLWADVNGDGWTDVLCTTAGVAWLATAKSTFGAYSPATHWVAQPAAGALCPGTTDLFAADVDGDGASEIVCNNPAMPANDIQVRKWNGTTFGPAQTWLGGFCGGSLRLGDFNGDGRTDIACESSAVSYASAGSGGFQADLLAGVGNGLGGTLQAAYTASSAFDNTNNPPPKWAVTSLTRSDGRGGVAANSYAYEGGYMDRVERRFVGFQWAWEYLPTNPGETSPPFNVYKFRQDVSSAGKLEAAYRADGSGHYLEQRDYFYSTNGTALPRRSLLSEERVTTWDGSGIYCAAFPCPQGKRVSTSYSYDGYGNVVQQVSNGEMDVAGDETTTAFSYYPNTSAYIVDKVAQTQVLAGVGAAGNKLSEQRIYYDSATNWQLAPSKGYPTKLESWLDQPTSSYVSRTLTYDTWGNPLVLTDETGKKLTTTWDPTYHVFPVSVFRLSSEVESTTWDPVCGTPLTRTSPNSQTTSFTSDALCRPETAAFPLGGFENRSYLDFGSAGTQRVRVETPSADGPGTHYVESYFDGWGRAWKTVKKGPSPEQEISSERSFLPRGGVGTESEPYYAGEAPRTRGYRYDALDRLLETTLLPNTTLGTLSYGVWSRTATDENGRATTTRFDAYGRQKQVERTLNGAPVTTHYAYDLLGRLTGITDQLGHAWSWSFDSLGRNLQRSDPDAGSRSFVYDNAGRVTAQTDAKSQTTTYQYDTAGRLTIQTNPAGNVTTSYSAARTGYFNKGMPTTISGPGSHNLTLDYDALGRLVKQKRTLDGVGYTVTRSYDAGGFLRGISYPDNDTLGTPQNPLGYDGAGRLRSIPGILTDVSYDASGRPLQQTNANGTTTTRTYSPERGFLTRILTTPGNPPIQDLQYSLEQPGAVGLVSEVTSPHPGQSWSYQYDDFYRLTQATNSNPAENQSFQYDVLGRIAYNSRIGDYSYPPPGSPRPHAPSSAGANAYEYDPNGNLLTGAGRSLTWNAWNRLASATSGSATVSFTYDAFGERLKKVTPTTTTRYPFGDDYEVTNGVATKYVTVEGLGVIAKRVGAGATAATYWHHTDRLGSISAVTNAAGATVFRKQYRPYGETLAQSGSLAESRGWIDQRNDPETGLTYLHARYYDPALGTFLSPDPMHPAEPGVGLNRYGYATGDPIGITDRTGLVWALVCGGGDEKDECWYGEYIEVWGGQEYQGGGEYRPPRTTPTWPNGDPILPNEPNPRPGRIVVTPTPSEGANPADRRPNEGDDPPEDCATNHSCPLGGGDDAPLIPVGGPGELIASFISGALLPAVPVAVSMTQGVTRAVPSIWTSTATKSAVQNAYSHFAKHASEFPALRNALQYAQSARNFVLAPPLGTMTVIRSNGDRLFYHPGSNIFAVADATGAPRTFFRPDSGLAYWVNVTQK